jgi:DNA-directed RNA polymerase specialized sigma24 family protein
MGKLCEKYWYPLYAFLRRRGRSVDDAKDLTQGFFCHFLADKAFEGFDPSRGKLRSYLLGALKNFKAGPSR